MFVEYWNIGLGLEDLRKLTLGNEVGVKPDISLLLRCFFRLGCKRDQSEFQKLVQIFIRERNSLLKLQKRSEN